VAAGGVLEYDACWDTLTVDRADPVTSTDPLPPLMTTAVTRAETVKLRAGG
jgi:hypothetical protein